MSTIGCNQFVDFLDSWLEGQQTEDVRVHVEGCADCRSLIEDLSAIQVTAGSFAQATDQEAPSRVWTALRAQLEQEGLIRDQQPSLGVGVIGWLEGLAAAMRGPALAGAYMAVLVALSFALGKPLAQPMTGITVADDLESSPLNAQLNSAERDTVSYVNDRNAAVAASLHQNLAIVDNDISLCEKSVREEPGNEAARDYLYEAYQEKSELLAQMDDRDIQ
jgi:hypothetical protein